MLRLGAGKSVPLGQLRGAEGSTDGKIVIAGTLTGSSNQTSSVARLNSNGSLDNSFGSRGTVTESVGLDDDGRALVLQGSRLPSLEASWPGPNAVLLRYNTDARFLAWLRRKWW
jgi:hypothetical protein